jgi:hypothetical protein
VPTIIDSLFLELGIDTDKFSKDQQAALARIAEFERRAKKSGKEAGAAIQSVGEAFKDLARETRVGAAGAGIDQLGQKLTALGRSAQVAGTAGGVMAETLGMLLSPTSLGIAATGLLGYAMWDLNKKMTATNATIYRQAELSGINAANLWDWGEAARTVGANPQDVTGGIAAMQTQIMGMGIGAADATPQLVALARLGVPFSFKTGVDMDKLVETVHKKAMAIPVINGVRNLGALRALTSAVMNDAIFDISTDPDKNPAELMKEIRGKTPVDTANTLRKSLESQAVLGKLGIAQDIITETSYGGEQGLLQAVVELLTHILDGVSKLVEWIVHPVDTAKQVAGAVVDAASRAPDAVGSAWDTVKNMLSPSSKRMSSAMQILTGYGMSRLDAEAAVGNMAWESSGMNPQARNGEHYGLGQWSKRRQGNFAEQFGYAMDDESKGKWRQFQDQLLFMYREWQQPGMGAAEMAKVSSLMGKTSAFMKYFENPGAKDKTLGNRFSYAQMAAAASANVRPQITITNDTDIHELNVHAPSSDPKALADALRTGVATHPLIHSNSQGIVSLGARAMAQ